MTTQRLPVQNRTTSNRSAQYLAWLVVGFVAMFVSSQAPAKNGPGEALTLGQTEAPLKVRGTELHSDPSGVNWRKVFTRSGADQLLLGVLNAQHVVGSFQIEVRQNGSQEPLQTISSGQIKARGTQVWIPLVTGDSIIVEIRAKDIRKTFSSIDLVLAPGFRGGAVFSHEAPPRFEDILQTNDPRLISAAKQVGALYFVSGGDWNVCSGFLVSPTQFVSNYHCVKTLAECRTARVIFDYETLPNGSVQGGTWYGCRVVNFNERLKALDIAVLSLDVPHGKWPQRPGLKLVQAQSQKDLNALVVIQHPGGAPLQITRRGCSAQFAKVLSPTSNLADDWAHKCDTSEGSSGSPLINGESMVVGIHHWGYEIPDFAERNRAISSIAELQKFLAQSK